MNATVLIERPVARVAVLRLHRPEALNALSTKLAQDIIATTAELAADRSVRVAILTGSGDRAFCAGADLKERQGMTPEQWHDQHVIFENAFAALRRFPKPIFAAVNGIAAGGGSELALNTDFMIAAESARFGQPEVRLGIMPGGGGTQLLPRRIPLGWARQLLMTGELIDAETALRIGLVNSLHAADELLPAAIGTAERIAANSPAALRQLRESVAEGLASQLEAALDIELEHYRRLVDHPDRYEGVSAFNERRPPAFADPE